MRYTIADIIVDLELKHPRLMGQCKNYIYTGDRETNIKIRFNDDFFENALPDFPGLDVDSLEYLFTGTEYYKTLIQFGGMMLHSSCVVYENKAYLFTAPSGTGKSTHTELWLKRFPGAYILNDDKPAIRITPNGVYAYGTPFSGKNDISVNTGVPIGGICILNRGEKNSIVKLSAVEALPTILHQTVRPHEEDAMDKLLQIIDKVLTYVPVYKLHCNMEPEAAEVAYNEMNKKQEELK